MNNRLHNSTNPNQGEFEKVLCVCSAGLLRSPSLAYYLSTVGYNTRACGSALDHALIPMDEVLIHWANKIVFVNPDTFKYAELAFDLSGKEVVVLAIPDRFAFRDPELMSIIEAQWNNYLNKETI